MTIQQERPAARRRPSAKKGVDARQHETDGAMAVDADDVTRCAAGDGAALERLYARHGRTCLSFARQILVDTQYAEDAVQEAFLQLWRNAATFDHTRSAPRTYLVMLTRARAVDRVRWEARRTSLSLVPEHDRADDRPGPEAQAVVASLGREAVAALAALSAVQREALVLAYWGGYTQREIAIMTVTPIGTVKTRMRAGLCALSEAFDVRGPS